MSIGRREFLKSSAALAAVSAAGGFSCIEIAAAAPIEVPTIDGLVIRVLVDFELRPVLSAGRSERRENCAAGALPVTFGARCTTNGASHFG